MAEDAVGATVFAMFMARLAGHVVQEVAPNSTDVALGQGLTELLPYNLMVTRRFSQVSTWIREQPDDVIAGPWGAMIERALSTAWDELTQRLGADPTAWSWGKARPLRFIHPFAIDNAWLSGLLEIPPRPGHGDATTISQGAVDLRDPLAPSISTAVLRSVIDVGDWDNSRFSVAGGQSGNPYSPHFADQLPVWASGEGLPIPLSEDKANARVRATLTLQPAKAK